MYIGAHVSIAGGVFNAPENAHKIGCECFQMFTRSPQGGPSPVLDKKIVSSFKAGFKKNKQKAFYVHTPYYINLASSKNRIRYGSIKVIRDDLERASLLGAKALMTHLGSSKDLGSQEALKQVIKGIGKILEGYKGETQFLIENSAGAGGTIIGDDFKEIGQIIKAYPQHNIGVCLDTCHA
ncbi:deoxyribonuclease IV, partial [Patescibacteria group bacterium]|nr:deoxyribonuclease IV [Patescibacteria group bacterium]